MANNGHPATPPPSDPSSKAESQTKAEPEVPLTSTQDDGLSKRPRDARLVHVILSSLGIHSYQERVPLQLLDFAYRYTSGILSDSLRLSAEGYTSQADRGNRRGAGDDSGVITIQALRQAIASRQGYTFQGPLAKEFMMEQAEQRNRVALPRIDRSLSMQLPPEKYCLTGVGWNLKDEWDSDEDVPDEESQAPVAAAAASKEDEQMGGVDDEEDDGDEEGAGRMEDVFGADTGGDTKMDET